MKITIEEVKQAYEKTGLQPTTHEYYSPEGQCCPFGAIILATHPEILESGMSAREIVYTISQEGKSIFGIGYMWGFTDAIDGKFFGINEERYSEGYRDGKKVGDSIF